MQGRKDPQKDRCFTRIHNPLNQTQILGQRGGFACRDCHSCAAQTDSGCFFQHSIVLPENSVGNAHVLLWGVSSFFANIFHLGKVKPALHCVLAFMPVGNGCKVLWDENRHSRSPVQMVTAEGNGESGCELCTSRKCGIALTSRRRNNNLQGVRGIAPPY